VFKLFVSTASVADLVNERTDVWPVSAGLLNFCWKFTMTLLRNCRILASITAVFCLGSMPTVWSQDSDGKLADEESVTGLIWFIGTVTEHGTSPASVDLGEAHALNEGDRIAIFRSVDRHFEPVGACRVLESRATWCIPQLPIGGSLRTGDRVIFVRTISQLGAGADFRNEFLTRQLVKMSNANSYSTLRQQEEADALQDFVARQPRWQRDQKRIAGTVRSESLTSNDANLMQPLFNQVLKFQEYRKRGIPVRHAVGAAWDDVLTALTPRTPPLVPPAEVTTEAAKAALQNAAANKPPQPAQVIDPQSLEKRVDRIRRHADRILFVRSREERNVVTIICTALELDSPSNERQWYSYQIAKTQFAEQSEDPQLLDDLEAVIAAVRRDEQ
jgi:hypothetical protein